jgi:hypothetical protein
MMPRGKILRAALVVVAGMALLCVLAVAVFELSFLWPWLDVTLRGSPALRDVYGRCSTIRLGNTVEEVTTTMRGLRIRHDLEGGRSMSFYAEEHSGDLCRVQFSLGDQPRVTRVDFLVD